MTTGMGHRDRSRLHTSSPPTLGSIRSSTTRSGGSLDPGQRRLPVMHALDPVAITDQVPSDDVGQRPVVVYDHDPAGRIRVAQHSGRRRSAASRRGRSGVTVDTVAGYARHGLRRTIRHRFVRDLAQRPWPRWSAARQAPSAGWMRAADAAVRYLLTAGIRGEGDDVPVHERVRVPGPVRLDLARERWPAAGWF